MQANRHKCLDGDFLAYPAFIFHTKPVEITIELLTSILKNWNYNTAID